MATKLMLISDLMLRLQKCKPSDDFELSSSQVAFWLTNERDELVKQYLDGRLQSNLNVDNYFIKKESCKALNEETDPCVDEDQERIYIRLKKQPLDLFKDLGVVRVRSSDGSVINKAQISTIDVIDDLEFGKSSTSNLIYYRDGKTKLVIEGIPVGLKDIVEIIVWYIPKENILDLQDDDEVTIPNELIPMLMERAEDTAKRQMFGFADLTNDGVDDIPSVPPYQQRPIVNNAG